MASPTRLERLRDWHRELGFRLRSQLGFSLHRVTRKPAPLETRLAALARRLPDPDAAERVETLTRQFPLARMAAALSDAELHEALYVLDLHARFVLPHAPGGPGLDVGARNGVHLPALATAVPGPWLGIELDGRRRYLTGVTREGYSRSLLRDFPECSFRVGSVLDEQGQYGVVHWFLPYVREGAFGHARLPRRFFQPAALLAHVWQRVAPGGVLFVVNQGTEEARTQQALFEAQGLRAEALGELPRTLSPFRLARIGWRVRSR